MPPIPETQVPSILAHMALKQSCIYSMKAAQVNKQGGIEEIEVVDVLVPTPKPEEILIKTEWAGVNFSKHCTVSNCARTDTYRAQSTLTFEEACIPGLLRLFSARKLLGRLFPFLARAMCELGC
jgi:hypothetical protein